MSVFESFDKSVDSVDLIWGCIEYAELYSYCGFSFSYIELTCAGSSCILEALPSVYALNSTPDVYARFMLVSTGIE